MPNVRFEINPNLSAHPGSCNGPVAHRSLAQVKASLNDGGAVPTIYSAARRAGPLPGPPSRVFGLSSR
ncbi:hypothetical protein OG585_41970 [Streptomyces sp. NBC_01340]|uniref:hypothetical protein n=1 Tax=unclassified Streptomyces TaxID=2593676 RepID=UPI0022546FF7|nr:MULTISPECIES: hypothetical protein [unclassified Streptomyces]MCX4459309.1 hypothetical protein [Streptomyces sp. NBC_01719]MCX4498666.1 hypothetical protein [Streptomyces sp. NBC_01728]MCX4595433.1 hypothetical protein [Streptomyces sp. NBC_01549]WSI43143.1 hypothetical protein OG585_41970 [Streptomyces sp. NBC_01340]